MKRLWALLRQRCPVCLQGQVFMSLFGMHTHCPVCGVKYERETGYFLSSMFIGYAAGFLMLAPTAVLLYFLDVSIPVFSLLIILETLILTPLIFRYARLIWMHADQVLDPRKPEEQEKIV
ncbi:MAG: DUF983 domain-containing protein [Caldilineaceae bacterium]|jgi:uncharacterized protein (DUF983 family)|nr:DUF983 domain-containing protein [Caldilineaceae bacterium]HMN30800.1 DUF983 domain-containing protein [Caldilineaceae bacterium]